MNGIDNQSESSPLISDSRELSKQHRSRCSRILCCRNVLALLQFAGFVTVYGMRANLSVALVAMVNQTYAEDTSGNGILRPECRVQHGNNTADDGSQDGQFNWDENTQGLILGSFFYGYLVTQLPGGWIAGRYGGKKVFGYGVLLTAIFTVLTPIAARTHVALLVAARVMAGFGEGVTYPAASVLWSRWTSPLERASYVVFSFTGGDMGAITSMPVSGYLSSLKHIDEGWPLAFYVFGGLGFLWFVIWMCLVHDSPAEHPRIALWEKQYIDSEIGHSQDRVTKQVPIPWFSIWTSLPLWALTIQGIAYSWGWYMFLTGLPSFFKEVLDFDITKNGSLTALPFIATFIVKNISGLASDWLLKHPGITCSKTSVRKGFATTGFLLASALLIPVGFLGCSQQSISVLLLALSCGALGIYSPTGSANPLDLSPRFAGITMGIFNCLSNAPGIAVPSVIGALTNHEPTRHQWKKLFYITCGIYIFGTLVFQIFGSGKEQSWNTPRDVTHDVIEDQNDVIGRNEVLPKELWRPTTAVNSDIEDPYSSGKIVV